MIDPKRNAALNSSWPGSSPTIKKDVDARHKTGHDERLDDWAIYPSR